MKRRRAWQPRFYQRSRKRFRTARAAWSDIRKSIKGDYRGIAPQHTRTHWRFRVI